MARHMLKYHVGLPLGIFGVLLLIGVPLTTAIRFGIVAGCAGMMLMMLGGSHDRHDAAHDVTGESEEETPVTR